MPSLFCIRCKALNPPTLKKCRQCGGPIGDIEAKQNCLTDTVFEEPKEEKRVILPKDMLAAPYFPYEPRECQMDIVKDITMTLASGNHIVMESGTGTGKTICALAGALHHAKMKGKKIIYLTRTISQTDQVMRELGAISEVKDVSGIAMTGRKKSCPMFRSMKGYEDLTSHVIANLCEERKSKTLKGEEGGCRYYGRVKPNLAKVENYLRKEFPTSDELNRFCESFDICPYEAKKALIQGMDVVVVPYIQILSEDIRTTLLAHMGCEDEQILLIVDEAHNLISAARDEGSFLIRMRDISSAKDEVTAMKDPVLFRDIRAGEFIAYLSALIKNVANEKLTVGGKKEAIVEHDRIESALRTKFSLSPNELAAAADRMISIGEDRTEFLLDRGEMKPSELLMLGTSLKDWISSDKDQIIKIIKADSDGEMLCASCIDPFGITSFIRSLRGAIHMSGTLQPLEQYVRTMGLPRTTAMRVYPTPFPPENRSVIYVNGVNTKHPIIAGMVDALAAHIIKLCNTVHKNTMVFFPSYALISKMRPMLEKGIDKRLYWDEPGRYNTSMRSLEQFKSGRDGVFFTVISGSMAEGIDFPGDELCFAIIVGIPFLPPSIETTAMTEMFDKKYGHGFGWMYVNEVPSLRKVKQAVGRLIRTEKDRGMAVILDSRTSRYASKLNARLSNDPAGDAAAFFGQR